MTELVIVPAWRRPEFLLACLSRLRATHEQGRQYLLALDRGHTPQVAEIASEFRHSLGTRAVRVVKQRHNYRGNSYNVLEAYKLAAAYRSVELVHLVEEDILVASDYFSFHRQAHALAPHAFAVSACRNQYYPLGLEPADDPTAVWLHGSYQSLGVSFQAANIRRFTTHAAIPYYRAPGRYCQRVWPASAVLPGHCEQDGLINRVRESGGWSTVYPATPRAYHAGFYGYNRGGPGWSADENALSISGRAELLLALDGQQLNGRNPAYKDYATTALDNHDRPPVSQLIEWPGKETQ